MVDCRDCIHHDEIVPDHIMCQARQPSIKVLPDKISCMGCLYFKARKPSDMRHLYHVFYDGYYKYSEFRFRVPTVNDAHYDAKWTYQLTADIPHREYKNGWYWLTSKNYSGAPHYLRRKEGAQVFQPDGQQTNLEWNQYIVLAELEGVKFTDKGKERSR